MKKGVRMGSIGILAFLLAGMLAGCGGSSDTKASDTNKSDAPKGDVEVTMITWESAAMNEKIMASMKTFEQENPGIKVKLIPTPLDNYGSRSTECSPPSRLPIFS